MQDYYVSPDIYMYYKKLGEEHHVKFTADSENIKEVSGGIVMNCNPFTYGHRYLIEQALRQVDVLYLFVVEEDASEYSFEERFEMVKQGVADLSDRIHVLPSGNYVISKETFGQYFEKDKEIREIADMDYDVRIFCEAVCKVFGITKRFVGTEPFDKVTKKYNETMARILPEYGIDFVEIPRLEMDGEAVNATRVRQLVREGRYDELARLVPESTVKRIVTGGTT
jgi:[citrate (pro-3S)-lyase] ligase